jgi:hypothetical protein
MFIVGGEMKKVVAYFCVITAFCTILLLFYFQYKNGKVELGEQKKLWNLKIRGLRGARDFTFDEKGNCFISYKDKVQYLDISGKSYILFQNDKLDICSLVYKDNILYYVSGTYLYCYDIGKNIHKELLNNLPSLGDYKEIMLLVKDDILYISVGSATNSGIVGEDNLWIKNNPFFHDITPKMLTIKAKTAAKQNTGAFVPNNTKNISGQIIPPHYPGNASVIAYNLKNHSNWLYAWGIRNIKGIDYNSEGTLYISVGGMEERGSRPVKGDTDYIYELKEDTWYGWPDYSGGDPINSPKFKGVKGERIPFLLDKHPSTNPPAPVYQHKNLGTMRGILIDRNGYWGDIESIYFCDSKDNIIYTVSKSGVLKPKFKFDKKSNIVAIKSFGTTFFVLDSTNGYLIYLDCNDKTNTASFTKNMYYYILGLLIIIIASMLWKFKSQ